MGQRDITTSAQCCPRRSACARFVMWATHGCGAAPVPLWACQTAAFEAYIAADAPPAGGEAQHAA